MLRNSNRDASGPTMNHRAVFTTVGRRYGSAYIYDLGQIRQRARDVKQAFGLISIYYAIKANPLQEIIKELSQEVDGFEIGSGGELDYARSLGIEPKRIIFAAPAKMESEVIKALKARIRSLHVESLHELEIASKWKRELSSDTLLAIRINTELGADSHLENMVGGPSRFGIDEECVPDLVPASLLAEIEGLHVYSGSQIRDSVLLERQFGRIYRTLERLTLFLGDRIRYANFGGGFGVPHSEQDIDPSLENLSAWFLANKPELLLTSPGEVALELGRYLVAPCGTIVTIVRDVKYSRGVKFVMMDCGFNGFLRPVLTSEYHQLVPVQEEKIDSVVCGEARVIFTGPLCTPIDTFPSTEKWVPKRGDVVAISNAGAYGWSMSPQFFLGQSTLAEVVIDGDSWRTVRERVTAEQYMRIGRSWPDGEVTKSGTDEN